MNIYKSFKADIQYIARHPILLLAVIAPFIIILFLILVFPVLSGFILLKTGFLLDNYYTITAITMISVIPLLFGMVYAFILLYVSDLHISQVIAVTPFGKKYFLHRRMTAPEVLSFFMVLISIILTNPVPSEGWLRTIFVSFLLSTQSPFIFLFIGSLAGNKVEGLVLSKLFGIFLVAVPIGLLLHHPWNYLAFFSPLYWISWAWITNVPSESLLYGTISLGITFCCIMILFRHFLKKHAP